MWKFPVNFVVSNFKPFEELEKRAKLPEDLTAYFEQCLSPEDLWITQTFIYLKRAGYPVTLSPKLVPSQICFIESSSITAKKLPYRSYVVACRCDRAPSILANQSTVMNELAVTSPREHHMFSWPQPVITGRDPSRGWGVKTVDFKGNVCNLWEPFRSSEFKSSLSEIGITLRSSTEEDLAGVDLYRAWGDYSNSDIILAVRNLTEYDFSIKPELKLTNAWRAGVPAILGPEPAFQSIRKSDLDYIEVRSVDEALTAIKSLKSEPGLYRAMVENGFSRAQEFSEEALTHQWVKLIEGPVFSDYNTWKSQSVFQKKLARPIRFMINIVREKRAIEAHLEKIRKGTRPLR